MRGEQFRAFFWLRWRMRVNQLRRGGRIRAIFVALFSVLALLLASALLVGSFIVGRTSLAEANSTMVMYTWDGIVVVFLFLWSIGLLSELQRSEVLSIDKFLHLPVSLVGAFVVNYISSFFSLTLLLVLPSMIGLTLGLAVGRGPRMLFLLPLAAALVFMVTALTYQFQGWLASLMANKRRRRTILFLITAVAVLLAQLPNLFNLLRLSKTGAEPSLQLVLNRLQSLREAQGLLLQARNANAITAQEYDKEAAALRAQIDAKNAELSQLMEKQHERYERWTHAIGWLNLVLPPGWLPLGSEALTDGRAWPALWRFLGLTLIGSASMWRSYRTTLRLYTGAYTSSSRQTARPALVPASPAPTAVPATLLVEKKVPFLSEQASAIALASFRSLLRAPEARMPLLSCVILIVVSGALLGGRVSSFELPRVLLPLGAMFLILISLVQLAGNQFGYDRDGFRVFVLCGAPRRLVLLGKNAALGPFALGLGLIAAITLQFIVPVRIDQFLAGPAQIVSMYLVFCIITNAMAIMTPVRVPAGALRATRPGLGAVLFQLAIMIALPLSFAPLLLPLGVEWYLSPDRAALGDVLYLPLAVAETVAVVFLYRFLLSRQGRLLQAREKKMLEVVRTKAE